MAKLEFEYKSNFQISRIKSLIFFLLKPTTGWFMLRIVLFDF